MTVSARTAPAPLAQLIDAVLREALRRRQALEIATARRELAETRAGERLR